MPNKSVVPMHKANPEPDETPSLIQPEGSPENSNLLVSWLYAEAQRRGLQLGEVASLIGMSRAYLFRLRTDPATTQSLGRDYVEKIAKFLGIPVIAVLLAAGQVRPEDICSQSELEVEEIARAIRFIADEPSSAIALADIESMTHPQKVALVRMYERATGKRLLSQSPYLDGLRMLLGFR